MSGWMMVDCPTLKVTSSEDVNATGRLVSGLVGASSNKLSQADRSVIHAGVLPSFLQTRQMRMWNDLLSVLLEVKTTLIVVGLRSVCCVSSPDNIRHNPRTLAVFESLDTCLSSFNSRSSPPRLQPNENEGRETEDDQPPFGLRVPACFHVGKL
jgi:hypothetical protein